MPLHAPPIQKRALAVVFLLAILFFAGFFLLGEPVAQFQEVVGENKIIVGAAFAALMFVSTVIAPITIFPVIPITALAIGPLQTALLSLFSWTAGAVVAFLIARHFGRPIVERLVSLEAINRYERHIPDQAQLLWIVLLRMVLPVDVLSYALGLFSRIPLWAYTLATFVGVIPFSVVLSYLGPAVLDRQFYLVGALLALLFVAATAGYFIWRQSERRK